MIQPMSPNHPSAVTDGGGGDQGPLAHRALLVTTSAQNATRRVPLVKRWDCR